MIKKIVVKKYPIIGKTYTHYKGGQYKALCVSKHTETSEMLVTYQSIPFGSYHSRPLSIWDDEIIYTDADGQFKTRRFVLGDEIVRCEYKDPPQVKKSL